MVRNYVPDAGHLVKVSFDPQAGDEQAGWRPALVLSPAAYNQRSGLAVMVPVTSYRKGYPFEVELPKGLKVTAAVLADHVKSLDWRVRKARYQDAVPARVLSQVTRRLALLLGIVQEA